MTIGLPQDGDIGENNNNLNKIMNLLEVIPRGETPICKQINQIAIKIKAMEQELIKNDDIALIIIISDGPSTDGDIVTALKQLVGLPVQINVRACTDESATIEYWHEVNAKVDINFLVLDDIECEATQIDEMNSWMTYGESLHRAREFGVVLPSMDNIDYCQLSIDDIKTIVQML